ncbi:hypothetical protein BST27_16415 [Mycobacterium intermedium]|uniref:Uncharacterized protein n=1 Tax=Mycobacterium intermedium TaxID=28445 RepID=A0A1E3SLN8_MYCIE|nr:hypothetical protein BHQ20_01225 [Mycobacterium intermedium]ORB02392.1 hypothetical protein BST27_16415 [Mycobacterium intermedium]
MVASRLKHVSDVTTEVGRSTERRTGPLHPAEPLESHGNRIRRRAHRSSWITWSLTARGANYRICHQMESQVYLEEGFA